MSATLAVWKRGDRVVRGDFVDVEATLSDDLNRAGVVGFTVLMVRPVPGFKTKVDLMQPNPRGGMSVGLDEVTGRDRVAVIPTQFDELVNEVGWRKAREQRLGTGTRADR